MAFVGRSGVGKTTVLTRLLPLLRNRGKRIAVVKSSHHSLELETAGSDSHQLLGGGAETVWLCSPQASLVTGSWSLQASVAALGVMDFDWILVEGGKSSGYPKIELVRREVADKPLLPQEAVVATLGDWGWPDRPQLACNSPEQWADFLESFFQIPG